MSFIENCSSFGLRIDLASLLHCIGVGYILVPIILPKYGRALSGTHTIDYRNDDHEASGMTDVLGVNF